MLRPAQRSLRNLFLSVLCLGSAACAGAPRADERLALEVTVPGVERLEARPVEGGLRVAGTARCEWPATPSRATFRVEARDASGRLLASVPVAAEARPATRRHKRDEQLSFATELAVPAGTARLVLTR